MTFKRLAAFAGAGVLVIGNRVMFSRPEVSREGSGEGGGGGTVDTPRMTIAMITHEVPGDSFWDLIRKGAETAAKKDNIELRYSNDPEAPNQANLVQSAIDSDVDGIAVTLAKPDAMQAAVEGRRGQGHSGRRVQRGHGHLEGDGRQGVLRSGRAASPARRVGDRLHARRRHQGDLRDPGTGPRRTRSALCRRQEHLPGATEILNVNGKDMPSVESTITAKLQQDPSVDYVVTLGAPFALTAVQSAKQRRQHRQDRHLRHQRRARRRDQGRRRAVGRRPAAVPAGLPRRRLAVAVPEQRQRDRRRRSRR